MSDDIKDLLQSIDWPQPRADLSARILASIDQDDESNMPLWFMARPFTRYAVGAGMAACLIAGLLVGSMLQASGGSSIQASKSFQWPGAGIALTYYMAS